MTAETIETRRKRLLHRARYRGFKEADILVGGFAAAEIHHMSASELDAFETLLNCNDHDIYAWVTGAHAAPWDVAKDLIEKMAAYDASVKLTRQDD